MAITANINNHAGLIWAIADLLRGDYKPAEYQKVVLPLVLLRRLDCVLEPTASSWTIISVASLTGRARGTIRESERCPSRGRGGAAPAQSLGAWPPRPPVGTGFATRPLSPSTASTVALT